MAGDSTVVDISEVREEKDVRTCLLAGKGSLKENKVEQL
jgi:hypothetical protein